MKKIFTSIRSSVELKLYKFPKQLDIPKNKSSEIASFFTDMESLFGSELIINELEEDDSEFDEEKYNSTFMNNLKSQESTYLERKNKSGLNSPKGYINKFKYSYTK